jgi:RimJ/RimL family protein N-acetyltransferase
MYCGELVRLRRVDPERDSADRMRWMNDDVTREYLGARPQRFSQEEIRKYLESCAASTDPTLEFAVETPDGRHIGGACLRGFNHVAHSAEFGIVIGEAEFRGKGYGTDITRLLVRIGFEEFNLNRIWLTVHEQNLPGIRAYEKAGFTKEGLLRSHGYQHGRYYNMYMMSILRDEYESRKGLVGR